MFPMDSDVEEKIHFSKKFLLERSLHALPPPSKGSRIKTESRPQGGEGLKCCGKWSFQWWGWSDDSFMKENQREAGKEKCIW